MLWHFSVLLSCSVRAHCMCERMHFFGCSHHVLHLLFLSKVPGSVLLGAHLSDSGCSHLPVCHILFLSCTRCCFLLPACVSHSAPYLSLLYLSVFLLFSQNLSLFNHRLKTCRLSLTLFFLLLFVIELSAFSLIVKGYQVSFNTRKEQIIGKSEWKQNLQTYMPF